MKLKLIVGLALVAPFFYSCNNDKSEPKAEIVETETKVETEFDFNVEQFADIKILRYQIPGWENLTLKEQKLVYYLGQAGLAGRDITCSTIFPFSFTNLEFNPKDNGFSGSGDFFVL